MLVFYDVFESAHNIYFITEYCNGGDLETKIFENKGPLNEKEALKITYHITLGLSGLTEKNIIHRDLKPANIFIHDSTYKLGDFGFAKKVHEMFYTWCGTKAFMAPEFYCNDPKTVKVDIWALGCILHYMLFNIHAWSGSCGKVRTQEYKIPEGFSVGKDTEDL